MTKYLIYLSVLLSFLFEPLNNERLTAFADHLPDHLQGNPNLIVEWARSIEIDPYAISTGPAGVFIGGRSFATPTGEIRVPLIAAFDKEGNLEWSSQPVSNPLNGSGLVSGIAVYPPEIYVSGDSGWSEPGNFLEKLNIDNGEKVWRREFGFRFAENSPPPDIPSVSVDATGIYVAGREDSAQEDQSSAGGSDAFIRKFDFNGGTVWINQFGTALNDAANSVFVFDGIVSVAGQTSGHLLECMEGEPCFTNPPDSFLRNFNVVDGNHLWTAQSHQSHVDQATAVLADDSGIYTAGENPVNAGRGNCHGCYSFVKKFNFEQDMVWENRQVSLGWEFPTTVDASLHSEHVYTTGFTFRPTSAGVITPGYIRKWDTGDGTKVLFEEFGDEIRAISVDDSGIYIGGIGALGSDMGGGYIAKLSENTVAVPVDIVPGVPRLNTIPEFCQNVINLSLDDTVKVAVLGTADLDVGQILPESIQLGRPLWVDRIAPIGYGFEDVGSPPTEENLGSCPIPQPDGIIDLVLEFDRQELAMNIDDLISYPERDNKIVLRLIGQLSDHRFIVGDDFGVFRNRVPVPVDIKPGSCPNPINMGSGPKSRGKVSVAILGTPSFDVSKVNPDTIGLVQKAFRTASKILPIKFSYEDVATPYMPFIGKNNADDCNNEKKDGFTDLVLKFDQLNDRIIEPKEGDTLVLELLGDFFVDGAQFVGEDVIVLRNNK